MACDYCVGAYASNTDSHKLLLYRKRRSRSVISFSGTPVALINTRVLQPLTIYKLNFLNKHVTFIRDQRHDRKTAVLHQDHRRWTHKVFMWEDRLYATIVEVEIGMFERKDFVFFWLQLRLS